MFGRPAANDVRANGERWPNGPARPGGCGGSGGGTTTRGGNPPNGPATEANEDGCVNGVTGIVGADGIRAACLAASSAAERTDSIWRTRSR